jgi:hypothetical protein
MYSTYERGDRLNAKRVLTVLAVAFAVTLAVVIGTRLSSDAIAVLVGVIAGVAASIPTALLLIVVTRRRPEDDETDVYEERRRDSPPVIVVAPGSAPQVLPQYMGDYQAQLPSATGRRRFRVMGFDDDERELLEEGPDRGHWYE